MHPLAQRLRTIHCDPLKAKSTNEARQLSAPRRGKRHIATDGFYVVQVLWASRKYANSRKEVSKARLKCCAQARVGPRAGKAGNCSFHTCNPMSRSPRRIWTPSEGTKSSQLVMT